MLTNSPLIKLPQSTTRTAPKSNIELKILRQGNTTVRPARFDLMARAITRPEQKMSIVQAAPPIGTCSVAAADTQITSRENHVLKRNQLLAGTHSRQLFD